MRLAATFVIALLVASSAACASAPRIGVSSAVATSHFTATELIARIKTALLNDPYVGMRRIDVQALDGDITLTGRVASTEERDRAIEITRGVEGVRSVRSEIEVRP